MKEKNTSFFKLVFFLSLLLPANSFALTVDISALVEGCGDGITNGVEQCDGSDLGGASCSTEGFDTGILGCSPACIYDTTSCVASTGAGGGGGNSSPAPATLEAPSILLKGYAFRQGDVIIFKDGQEISRLKSGNDAKWKSQIKNLIPGTYNFSVLGIDKLSRRSSLVNFTTLVSEGVQVTLSDIFVPPTLTLSSTQLQVGEEIILSGESVPNALVKISAEDRDYGSTTVSSDGSYQKIIPINGFFTIGNHMLKAKSILVEGLESSYGTIMSFSVGSLASTEEAGCVGGDQNCDGGINIADFSIMAYWFKRGNPPPGVDLNADGRISIEDFSILAYYWSN